MGNAAHVPRECRRRAENLRHAGEQMDFLRRLIDGAPEVGLAHGFAEYEIDIERVLAGRMVEKLVAEPREEHDRSSGDAGLDGVGKLDAIHARHGLVGQHEVKGRLGEKLQGFVAVFGRGGGVAAAVVWPSAVRCSEMSSQMIS